MRSAWQALGTTSPSRGCHCTTMTTCPWVPCSSRRCTTWTVRPSSYKALSEREPSLTWRGGFTAPSAPADRHTFYHKALPFLLCSVQNTLCTAVLKVVQCCLSTKYTQRQDWWSVKCVLWEQRTRNMWDEKVVKRETETKTENKSNIFHFCHKVLLVGHKKQKVTLKVFKYLCFPVVTAVISIWPIDFKTNQWNSKFSYRKCIIIILNDSNPY